MPLPEQQYFTLSELSERWDISERRILELILNSELRAVALVSGMAETAWADEKGNFGSSRQPAMAEVRTWFDLDLLFSLYTQGEGLLSRFLEDGREYTLTPPQKVTADDLLVTRSELLEFESTHSMGPDSEQPEDTVQSQTDSELSRCRRTLAALAIGLADKYPTYKNGKKPNASQLAKLATDHLRDETSDRTPHGFSETTARLTIAEALKACPELAEKMEKTD